MTVESQLLQKKHNGEVRAECLKLGHTTLFYSSSEIQETKEYFASIHQLVEDQT